MTAGWLLVTAPHATLHMKQNINWQGMFGWSRKKKSFIWQCHRLIKSPAKQVIQTFPFKKGGGDKIKKHWAYWLFLKYSSSSKTFFLANCPRWSLDNSCNVILLLLTDSLLLQELWGWLTFPPPCLDFIPFFPPFHTTNWLDLQQRDLWWALVLKSSDLGHDSFVQSACSTCWFDCHFQFSHDPAVLEWGISGRKWDWKLVLLVWQLHSSESNAKRSSYLYSDLMLKQGIHCICLLLRQEVRKSSVACFFKFFFFF